MAGLGRPPKSPALLQRRNRAVTKAVLPTQAEAASYVVPELPVRGDAKDWHVRVVEWWTAVWRSPMAAEYLDADMRSGLYLLADLYQARWAADNAKTLIALAAEIRLQEVRFGLSPIDRRRLQWQVGREGNEQQPSGGKAARSPRRRPAKDPRRVLKVV